MREKTKKVYYCDYCKKKSLRRDAMERHEYHCTLNPYRHCRVCEETGDIIEARKIIKEIKTSVVQDSEYLKSKEFLDELKQKEITCPACTLAILRQLEIQNFHFDYNEASRIWWNIFNEAKLEGRY